MRKFIVFLLSLTISLTPTFLFASAAEAWTIQEVKYNDVGKNLSYTAKRANAIAANDYVYKANVGVTAARTGATAANMIRMGLAGAAIYGIVEGVGWIIDNGVVKKPINSDAPVTYYIWKMAVSWSSGDTYCKKAVSYSTGQRAVQDFMSCAIQNNYIEPSCSMASESRYACQVKNKSTGAVLTHFTVDRFTNANYDPSSDFVPVTDDQLGQAINDSPQAPSVLPDIYNPNNPARGPAPEATADALDNAVPEPVNDPSSDTSKKPNKDTDGDGIPDTYDPNEPDAGETTTWPKACDWIPVICEWYVKYKEDSKKVDEHREKETEVWTKEETHRADEKTFWQKVEDWFDWTSEDPDTPEPDELDIQEPDEFDTSVFSKDRFSVSRQCPVPESHTINLSGISVDFSFDLSPICQVFDFARPALVACSYLYAAYIVIGAARNG